MALNADATYTITRKCENHYHNRWSNSIEYPYSVNLTPGYVPYYTIIPQMMVNDSTSVYKRA